MKTTKDSITLTPADITAYGSIREAIIAACDQSDYLASCIIGPAFSTSGPGPGFSAHYDACDFAARALGDEWGAVGYVDAEDGRLATLVEEGGSGVEWTEGSVVLLSAPEEYEVDENRAVVTEMIEAIDSGLCIAGYGDWASVRALHSVSEAEALEKYDIEIIKDSVIYYDDCTQRWYLNPRTALIDLRRLMGSDDEEIADNVYSHWCAGCLSVGEYKTREEAVEACE